MKITRSFVGMRDLVEAFNVTATDIDLACAAVLESLSGSDDFDLLVDGSAEQPREATQ